MNPGSYSDEFAHVAVFPWQNKLEMNNPWFTDDD
jgi:hypothetical protein